MSLTTFNILSRRIVRVILSILGNRSNTFALDDSDFLSVVNEPSPQSFGVPASEEKIKSNGKMAKRSNTNHV